MPDGVCPLATFRPTTFFGYPMGKPGGNQPRFFVDHVMAGFKRTMDAADWFSLSNPSVHFAIGKDGSISQYVRIQDAAWGNGRTGSFRGDRKGIDRYDRANRHLAAIEQMCPGGWTTLTNPQGVIDGFALIQGGVNMPNSHCISIEHEDEAKGGHIEWTPAMLAADIALKRWCVEEIERLGLPPIEIDPDCLVGHFQLDAVNRENCPGSAWPKAAILSALIGRPLDPGPSPLLPTSVAVGTYNRQDVWPTFFSQDLGLKMVGGQIQKINTRADFGWPANARYGEIEIMLRTGHVIVRHGDGQEAGRVGWETSPGQRSHGIVRVMPDRDGWIELFAPDIADPVQFDRAHGIAFWT